MSAYELSSSANRESFDLTSVKPPEMEVKEEDEEVKGSITKCQATVLLGKKWQKSDLVKNPFIRPSGSSAIWFNFGFEQ